MLLRTSRAFPSRRARSTGGRRWLRAAGTGAPGLASREAALSALRKMASAALATPGVWCRKGRRRLGTDSSHRRTGRCGITLSVRCADTSAMRWALQEGHTPRPYDPVRPLTDNRTRWLKYFHTLRIQR